MKPEQQPFAHDTEGVWLCVPAETYHKAPGVSQSRLKEFGDYATPKHYHAGKPKVPTADMEFGTICHTAVLEPQNLASAYHIQPETYPASETAKAKKPSKAKVPDAAAETVPAVVADAAPKFKPWHGGADFCKQWVKDHSDRPIIDKEAEARIPKVVEAITKIPLVAAALQYGQREVSFFKRDFPTGLLCKCRTDLLAVDSAVDETWIFDLKKVQSGGGGFEQFQKDALDRGYHIQGASYLHITGASRFAFVVFDDDVPFDAILWEPDEDMLRLGLMEYRQLLNRFAECMKSGEWPGYPKGINKLTLPWWGKKRLSELVD